MTDNKKYIINVGDQAEEWTSDMYAQKGDSLFAKYKDAEVFEVEDAADFDEDPTDHQYIINVGDESEVWDGDMVKEKGTKLKEAYPDVKIQRVSYKDYWGEQATANREQRALLAQPDQERNAKLADLGYYDDITGEAFSYTQSEEGIPQWGPSIGLQPLSSIVGENEDGTTSYADPKVAEFFANDTSYTDRQAEIARLDAEYESNPSVIAQREWEAQWRAEQAKYNAEYRGNLQGEIDALEATVDASKAGRGDAGKRMSPKYGMSAYVPKAEEMAESEKRAKLVAARTFLEKANIADQSAGKGFWGAAGDTAHGWALDSATQGDVDTYNKIGNILTNLEKDLGGLGEEQLTDEVLEQHLSPEDKLLILSFFNYNEAMANAQVDMKRAYKAGKIFAESVPFMLEFLVTGGFASAGSAATKGTNKAIEKGIAKALVKWVTKKSAKKATRMAVARGLQKTATGLMGATAGTLARTLASHGTYNRAAEESVKIEDGHLDRTKNVFKSFADSYIENLSEISGGLIGKGLGLLGKGIGKAASMSGIPFSKLGSLLADNKLMQTITAGWKSVAPKFEALGFHGIFEEVGEEYIGNAIREFTIQPGALAEMHKDDNFGAMLIGFAPMTLFGGAMSAVSIGAKNIEAANLGKKLRETLGQHYSEEQIDHMMNLVSGAENSKDVWEAIKPLTVGLNAEETQQLFQYGAFMAQNKAMLFAKKAQDDNLAQAKRAELQQTYNKFWQENAEGVESVQLASLNDGRTVFVVSEPTADGVVSIIDASTGAKGFTNVSNYKTEEVDGAAVPMTGTWSMDAYLESEIASERRTAEGARMEREYNEQVQNLQSQIQEGTKINLGTEGNPVIMLATGKFVKDGVVAVDQAGNTHTIGWNQVADAMNQPIGVKTDQQLIDEEMAAIVARNAERRKRMTDADPAMTDAVNESAAQSAEVVAQENRHIPMNEDGTVNEAAFWEQDPEGYVQWNDEQNQDGGADSLQQVAITKAVLTSLLAEAQQAQQTSNPAERKAAKQRAQEIAEKINRLTAIEASYAEQRIAPLRERAMKWKSLTNAPVYIVETEEDLASISGQAAASNKGGARVRGFAKDGRAYIYLPGIVEESEIDAVFMHEAVAHTGLKGLLGQQAFDELCDQVWEMMSPEMQTVFINYPGVNGNTRAAADEYIAHLAETMGAGIAEAEEKTIWQSVIDFIRNVLRSMGIALNVSESELSDLIHMAYADLAKNMAEAEDIAVQQQEARVAEREAPSAARQEYDTYAEDLTHDEIKAVAANDFNAAQEAYNALVGAAPKVEMGESAKDFIARKKAYNEQVAEAKAALDARQALMDEIARIDAANAPVLTDAEVLEQEGLGVDTQNDDVRMSVRYVPTEKQREMIIGSIMNVTGRTREEAERWLASETSLAAMINEDLQYLDYVADPKYKAIKDNSDYPQGTVDFNNICRKRLPFTRMFTRLQRRFPNRVFTAEELADIRTIMSKDDLMVACGLCYVEDRRQMVGEVAQSFIDGLQEQFKTYANNPTKKKNAKKFNELIAGDTYVPQVYDLTTQEGLDKLYNEHRGIWEAFQAFNNARGQQSQNLLQGYAEYKREILSWSDKKVKSVNDNGGLRIFSYSDFEAHHLIDVVQIIIDCAAKGVKIQGYTKVPEFARAVANTGIKLNRSLIPLGDTGLVDGQLAFDPVEGIDINDPNFLESNDNVGNILIGINDEQIRIAMADPRIHYIIPYHARQKENIRQKLNVGAWTNYISTQNERNISDGKRVKDNINIYTDILTGDITTDRQFVEKYLQLCKEKGRIPKFDQFLERDAEGNYLYTPGYYKFLVDFKLFDENGNILPQQPVVAEFDDAFNMQILENYAKDERESTGEQMNETYDKIVDALKLDESAAEGEDMRFSKKTKAPETAVQPMAGHSTVVSSADGANVIKNLETLLEEYRNKPSNRQKTFIGDLARALGLRNNGNHSNYGTFEAVNGEVFTYRISDHNSSTKNMEDAGNPNGISIVITHKPNSKITKDGNAHIVEFYYNTQKLLNADGKPYADIIQSVIQSLYSGEYNDTTGLAERDEAISFSVITPQMDADYLAAVERGDMETAQRMVLEAAKLAMPNTKVVDENGNPKVVYHGRGSEFNVFEHQDYAYENASGKGFYFTDDPKAAALYSMSGFLDNTDKMQEALYGILYDEYGLDSDTAYELASAYIYDDEAEFDQIEEAYAKAIKKLFPNPNVLKAFINIERPYDIKAENAERESWQINKVLDERNLDGVIDENFSEAYAKLFEVSPEYRTSEKFAQYMVRNSNQIKSAEPVTYDDAGNVIPLSERFNPENEDIRFSARTDEQREKLFADAKARFGLTNNFKVAGYMLPDGSLLDFSEANDGGDPNQRTLDHREIEGIIMDEGREYDSRWMYLADFMNEGAIRLLPEYAGINLMKAPTKEQRDRLFDFIYKYNGEVILEIADERLNNVAYVEYDRRTSPSRIFRDIDGYFNEGIVPQQDIRFSVANESQAIFVSNAARAVEGIKMEKATPEQWLAMIEKNSGLKAGEDKWMGLSEWLKASNKKTLTKAEVLDFISDNMIQIEEQHYSSEGVRQEADRILNENYPGWEEAFSFDWDPFMEEPHSDIYNEVKAARLYNETHEDQVETDEDGDIVSDADYNKVEEFGAELAGIWYGRGRENTVREINGIREEYTTNGLTNLHEIALTVPTIESWKEFDEVHFGDAGDGRAVAWIRFGETEITEEGSLMEYEPKNDVEREIKDYIVMGMNRWGYPFEECVGYAYNQITDAPQESVGWTEEAVTAVAEGMRGKARKRKILVIDEIQSKRHQEGRDKGYKKSKAEIEQYLSDNSYEVKEDGNFYNFYKNGELERRIAKGLMHNSMDKAKRFYVAALNKDESYNSGIPDAPFDKNWHELSMKRMLRYAAEEGYDVIAWTKGEQQAERYNIGKVISGIHKGQPTEKGYQRFEINSYTPSAPRFIFTDNEGKIVEAMDNDGEEIQDYVGKNLSEVFGKDLAIKMLGAEENTRISHDEMRVGGEGMKGFYDKMLPAFMNKYGKKWGIKVEDIDLSHLQSDLTMHSVPVTEEMKASVMEGQVMFSAVQIDPAVRQEMDTIKAKAMWNGTFMKAPNGAETKLTEDQWLLVRTKNFINWFGDWLNDPENAGVLLDENGEPKVVYHGTDAVFNTFDSAENDRDYKGFYFTDSQEMAQSYGQLLKPVFVRLPNAYVVDGGGRNWNMLHKDLFDIITDIEEQITAHEAAMSNWLSRGLVSQKQFDHFKDAYYDKVNFIKDESKNSIVDIIKKYVYRWQIRNFKSQLNVNRTRDVEWFIQQVNPEANIIFKDITDYGGRPTEFTGAHDVYVTTKANNIKSATETTGLFSESEDIRYSSRFDVNTNPTEAQKKAGNYKMGHLRLDGYNITIENPKGSVRRGIDSKGNEWENTLNNDYGYIRGTEGVDGDHIDVYLSDNPAEGNVFVIDQVNPETREFDEHKVMYGFNSVDEAREAYLANFSEGWNGLGTITEVTKDEFRKWIDSSHRKTKPFSEYKSVKTDILDEGDIRYSVVTDPALLERLDSEPTIKVYRAMQLIDGKLYPPMSAKVDGKMREPIELGKWEQAEERPDLADEKGYFKLDKGNKTSLKARYNPYFHTSPTPLNDQFSSAQTRPELVTVEVEVPESELTSGYKAEKAKDSVGQMEWKAGVVQGKLSGTRTVILSRWDKPIRIVPDSEVADKIVEMFDGKDITMPSNVVTPSLRAELESRGIPFVETDNSGKPVEADTRYSVLSTPTDEIVAEGMKFSIQDFARLAGNIFQDMPESFRKEAIEETFKRGWDMQSAIFQTTARLAEKENWDESDKDLAKVIREKVQDAMDESGVVMSRPLTTKEALWMLYRSTEANGDSILDAAKRSIVAHNLGFDSRSMALKKAADDIIRYSVVRNRQIDAATDMYNYEANLWTSRLAESWLDMNQSVIALQNALADASGKPIESWEDVVLALNQLSSKSYADKKKYMRDYLEPLWKNVRDKVKRSGLSVEQIERYMMLKHGLERNKKFAMRDAKQFYKDMFDKVADRMKNTSHAEQVVALSEANKRIADIDAQIATASGKKLKDLQEARERAVVEKEIAELVLRGDEQQNADDLQMYYNDIEAGTNPKYAEFREKDYGGLTSMFMDQIADVRRKDYKTEEAYQAALLASVRPRFDKVADMEAAAQIEVDGYENRAYMPTLWDAVNAATKEILRHQHASGMITTEQYDAVRNMFDFYVPLRGFADNTAEDMYSYYMNNSAGGFAKPIIAAKGRKTRAESPLGWIGAMAESAIQQDNKNEAKMKLYYALMNRPDTGVLSLTEMWYEFSHKDPATGKKVFVPAYPPATGRALSADDMRQHMDAWEQSMKAKQAVGEAYKKSQGVNLGGSVIFQDKAQDAEHIIRVKVAGKDYAILVNGNPRAAQAINGLLNPDANVGPVRQWYGELRRGMSALMTSFSPLFWVANYQRDLLSSFMRTSESEGWKQAFKYLGNRFHGWKTAKYIYKYDNGKMGNSYYDTLYKEFAENGGITGYTFLTTNKEYEKLLEDYIKNEGKEFRNWVKGVWDKFMGFGEAIEQVSRFAAYITARESGKSIEQSVAAAKEVSVNFNRKGSAKPISLDELERLRDKNGKPLNAPKKAMAIVFSAMPLALKELYFFFNASIQALSSSAKLARKSPGKAMAWAGMYMGLSVGLAFLNYLLADDDDDNDYLDLPDYLRHSTALFKMGDNYYFKWSLPQEMRPFYATADILVSKAMGKTPHKNAGAEILLSMAEWLPVNPFGTEDPLLALVPDAFAPLAEIKANQNSFGGKIYDDMSYRSEEVVENIPAYRKGTSKTGKIYVDMAEFLNDISGGDEVKKGAININPAIVEHLVEGYGGGIYDFGKMIIGIPGLIDEAVWGEGVEVRDIPFVNKVLLSTDETNMYSHTNDAFNYYRGVSDNAQRIEKEYFTSDDPARAEAYRQEDDWRIHLLYKQYEEDFKDFRKQLDEAVDKTEISLLREQQNAVREQLLNDIANGVQPDPLFEAKIDMDRKFDELSTLRKAVAEAAKKEDAEAAEQAQKDLEQFVESEDFKRYAELRPYVKAYEKLRKATKEAGSAETRQELEEATASAKEALDEKLKEF